MMNFLCTIDLIEENLIKWWHFMHLFSVNWARILHNSLPIWLDYSLIFAFIFVGNLRNRGPRKRIDESNAPWTHLPLQWILRWMAKIQFKPNKEEKKNCKRKSSQGEDVHAWCGVKMLHIFKWGLLLFHVWN